MDKLKGYILWAITLSLPIIQHYSTNNTIDTLISIVVWSIMLLLLLIGVIVAFMGLAFWFMKDEMEVDKMEATLKPLAKMRWWKTAITLTVTLGVYAYVDWTGPAVTYVFAIAGLWIGASTIRAAINSVVETHNDSTDDGKPDELKNLKRSLLDD